MGSATVSRRPEGSVRSAVAGEVSTTVFSTPPASRNVSPVRERVTLSEWPQLEQAFHARGFPNPQEAHS